MTTLSAELRAALLTYGPAWVVDGDELTEFCDAFGGSLPAAVLGARWEDIAGRASVGIHASAPTVEAYRDTPAQMEFLRHNADVDYTFTYEMPHQWMVGSDVNPHIHYVAMVEPVAPPKDVYFSYAYTWKRFDEELPAVASWTTGNKTLAIAAGHAFKMRAFGFGPFSPPPTANESSVLLLAVSRLGTDPADTYSTNKVGGTPAANLGLVSYGCHVQLLATGTTVEFPA